MKKSIILIKILIIILVSLDFQLAHATEKKIIKIASGPITGIYYPIANNICKIFNQNRKNSNIRCIAHPTQGSVYNLDKIASNKFDFAIIQSEVLHEAILGKGEFKSINKNNINSILSLHPESVTVVVRDDSNINSFNDLKNKIINIGQKGSGTRRAAETLINVHNLKLNDFKKVHGYNLYSQAEMLCHNKIDAAIYVTGHPSAVMNEAMNMCELKILDIKDELAKKFITKHPDFRITSIPANLYSGNHNEIKTIGVKAILITSKNSNNDLVYKLVKGIFEDLKTFKESHPALENINYKEMISNCDFAPLHEGAIKYYREIGIE